MFCTSYFFYRERPHCVSSTGQSFTPTPVDRKVSKILLRATSSKKIKVQKKRNSAAKQNKNNKGAVVKDTIIRTTTKKPFLLVFDFIFYFLQDRTTWIIHHGICIFFYLMDSQRKE
jgi:hypothetical protein